MVKISSGLPLGSTNAANTVTDFQVGTDVIGIAGLSGVTGFDDLTQAKWDGHQIVTPTSLP